jgi:hypothetical protein
LWEELQLKEYHPMATNPIYSNAGAVAALNALLTLLNAGGAGKIKIFTGAAPATTETADSGTALSTGLLLSATAFPTSVDNSAGGATATANAITSDTNAAATGTAGYFRAYSGAGTCILQGTVGTAAADMILNTTSIVAGSTVAITSWTVTLPDGSGTD